MRLARALAACALLMTLVLLSSNGLQSQEKKDVKVKGQLPQNWSKLNLTAAQKEEVYKLNRDYKEKIDKLNDEIKQLNEELTRKRVAVLTDEQRKKLLDMVAGEPKAKAKPKDTDKK
jgi:hypothetical protein